MKIQKLISLARNKNATVSRIVTEIVQGGWNWSGKAVTTKSDRKGLVKFCKAIRSRAMAGMGMVAALDRVALGGSVTKLALP